MLQLPPQKTMAVHALKKHDPVSRISFCNWFLQSVHNGEVDAWSVSFPYEAWFSLYGEVYSQNSLYSSAENPGLIHELPLHDESFVFSVQ
jgi:hypothetical protein